MSSKVRRCKQRVGATEGMEITTAKQCASAFAITSYYYPDVIKAIQLMIDETQDWSELEIVSGLLRGSLRHMLDRAQERMELARQAATGGD